MLIILVIGLVAMYVNCSYVPVFNGIDISHHNRVDWKKIKLIRTLTSVTLRPLKVNRFVILCAVSMPSERTRMDCL